MDIKLNQNDFQHTVANNKKVLIDFYADWCGPCQVLLPTIHKLAEDYQNDVIIKKVNVDETEDTMGVKEFMRRIKEEFPELKHGYYNPPMERITGNYELDFAH